MMGKQLDKNVILHVEVQIGVKRQLLRFFAPSTPGAPLALAPSVITIGRSDPTQTELPHIDLSTDDSVSRQHAELHWEGGRISLVDKDSTNGTWLNGQRVIPGQPNWIEDGDRIAVGRIAVLSVRLTGAERADSPPPL